MTEMVIQVEQFPAVRAADLQVGDGVEFVVTGRVVAVEEAVVDVSTLAGPPSYTSGSRTVRIVVTGIGLP